MHPRLSVSAAAAAQRAAELDSTGRSWATLYDGDLETRYLGPAWTSISEKFSTSAGTVRRFCLTCRGGDGFFLGRWVSPGLEKPSGRHLEHMRWPWTLVGVSTMRPLSWGSFMNLDAEVISPLALSGAALSLRRGHSGMHPSQTCLAAGRMLK